MESEIVMQKPDELTRKVNALLVAHNHDTRPQN
jgi:hypothetical protein